MRTATQTIEHPYKPRLKISLLGLALFGGGAAMWWHEALGNDRGLVINGIIHLETPGATKFYWWMAGICAVFAALMLVMLGSALTSDRRLTLDGDALSVPRSAFARTNTVVRRADIAGLEVVTVQKQRFLYVHHPEGTLTILRSCLPNDAAFDEVCAALRDG